MKLRVLKKPRMFRGWEKCSEELAIVKFSKTTFGVLKKINGDWMLGFIPYKGLDISVFNHEPTLQGNGFIIDTKTVPLNYFNFSIKVFFYMNKKLKINIGWTKMENLVYVPT